MSDDRRREARRLFMELADLPSNERDQALASLVDVELRAEVRALLHADKQAGAFLSAPTANAACPPSTAAVVSGHAQDTRLTIAAEHEGRVIGRYKLLQPIGEGGFGTVWMAEQREPVKRRVALKVIKLGMDTRQVIARFEAERQALALMDHPNIARVLDAGSTDGGRPFFVMEYIKGVPIVEYCDAARLDTRFRLALFTQVCNAIQHAHQKGIIHRDIKPSNVLVTLHDGVPVPKVIDFGIAKATSTELTQKTLFTEHRQMIGTPAYMSPEQAEMSGLDVDTRTDIYSLGVLLYELLTGTTPFDSKSLLAAGFAEMLRIIREVEPARPSTRLSSLGDTGARTAQLRLAENPRQLSSILRGDLDWIVMKCLEKDRNRRYDSAGGLVSDIRRHLADEPVSAGPPSSAYRLSKFVKRHRTQVLAGCAIALALMFGAAGATLGMLNAMRSAAAERAAKIESEALRDDVERNLAFAKQANEVLAAVFSNLDPGRDYASVADFRNAIGENLDKAALALGRAAIGDPREVAAIQRKLGESQLALGAAARAVVVLEEALETMESQLGREHIETLRVSQSLAAAYQAAGNLAKAMPLLERTFEAQKSTLGPDHEETLSSMQALAAACSATRQIERAITLAEEALRICVSKFGNESAATCGAKSALATIYMNNGLAAKALPLLESAYRFDQSRFDRESLALVSSMESLANCAGRLDRTDEAIRLYEEALRVRRAKLGRDHPSTLITMGNLAIAYSRVGKADQALLLYEETYKLREAKLGGDHPETIGGLNHLAGAYWSAGKRVEAIRIFEEVVRLNREKFGPDAIDTLNGMNSLAANYEITGDPTRARELWEEVLQRRRAVLGPQHLHTIDTMIRLGKLAASDQRAADAEQLLTAAIDAARNLPPAQRESVSREAITPLIALLEAVGRSEQASRWKDELARISKP